VPSGNGADLLCIFALDLQALLCHNHNCSILDLPARSLRLPLGARGMMAAALTLRCHHALDGILTYVSMKLQRKLGLAAILSF